MSLEGRGEWATRNTYFSRDAVVDTAGVVIADRKQLYSLILGFTAFIGN